MGMDITTLGVKVESKGIDQATTSLDNLGAQAERTEKSVTKLSERMAGTSATFQAIKESVNQLKTVMASAFPAGAFGAVNTELKQLADTLKLINQSVPKGNFKIDFKGVGQDAEVARKGVASLNQSLMEGTNIFQVVGKELYTLRNLLGGTMLAAAMTSGAKSTIEMADAWALMGARLRMFAGDAAKAAVAQEQLFNIAQELRVPLTAVTTLYSRLVPALQEYGLSTQTALSVTQSMGAALKVSGATGAETASVMLQFSQSMAAGRLNGAEFNAVAEGAPIILRMLSKELGVTRGELKKMAAEGLLTTGVISSIMAAYQKELEDQAKTIPDTVASSFGYLENAFTKYIGQVNESVRATSTISVAIKALADNLDALGKIVEFLAVVAISGLIVKLLTAVGSFAATTIASTALAESLGITATAAGTLGTVLTFIERHPVIIALTVLATAGYYVYQMFKDTTGSAEDFNKQLEKSKGIVDDNKRLEALTTNLEDVQLGYNKARIELERLQDIQARNTQAQNEANNFGFGDTMAQKVEKARIELGKLATSLGAAKNALAEFNAEAQAVKAPELSETQKSILLYEKQIEAKRKFTESEKKLILLEEGRAKIVANAAKGLTKDSDNQLALKDKDIAETKRLIEVEKQFKDTVEATKKAQKLEESVEKKYTVQLNAANAFINKLEEETGLRRKLTEAEKEAAKIQAFLDANKAKGGAVDELKAQRLRILAIGKEQLDNTKALQEEQDAYNKSVLDMKADETYKAASEALQYQVGLQQLANQGVEQSILASEMHKQALEAESIAALKLATDMLEARKDSVYADSRLSEAEGDKRVKALQDEIDANNIKINQYNKPLPLQKQLSEEMFKASQIKLLEVGRSPGQILAEGFGEAGTAIGKMIDTYEEFGKQSKTINNELAAQLKYLSDKGLGDNSEEVIRVKQQAAEKQVQINAGMYASMAGAAKGFFSENSKGYQLLAKTEKAFRVVELALAMKSFVQKMAFTTAETTAVVAGEATKTVAQTASTEAGVALSLTQAAANAQAAVTGAFVGIGPSGFVTGAAMIGIMAGLGFALSGGGGGGPSMPSAEETQKKQGAGSVFGDVTAKSESIDKSLSIIKDNSGIALKYNEGMLNSLKTIESNISSFARLLLRQDVPKQLRTSGDVEKKGQGSLLDSGGFVAKALFGFKKSVTDIGLEQTAQTMKDILTAGLNIIGYQDIETKTKKWGKTKTSSETIQTDLSEEIKNQFTMIVGSMGKSIVEAAKVFKMDGENFTKTLESFVVDIGRISLKDMSAEDIQKTLGNVFSKLGDDMAAAILPGFEEFQQIGEGYYETIMRVASTVATVDGIFYNIGQTMDLTGMESIKAKMNLVELAGSMSELAGMIGKFYDKFYTSAEKQAILTSNVADQFNKLGIEMIDLNAKDARIKFREIVNAYRDADQETYVSLLKLSDAIDQLTPEFEKTANASGLAAQKLSLEDHIKELTMSKTDYMIYQRQKELAAMDASLRPLQERIYALEDEAAALANMKSATQSALSVLEKSVNNQKKVLKTDLDDKVKNINELKKRENEKYEAERDRLMQQQQLAEASWESQKQAQVSGLNTMLDAAQATIDNIKGLFDDLTTSIEKLRSSSAVYNKQSYSAAQSQLDSALMLAKTAGVLPDSEKFKGVLDTLTSLDNSSFSSSFDFERQQLQTAGKLSQLQGIAGSKMSAAEATVAAIENNIKAVEAQSSAASSYYSTMLSDLDIKHQEQMKKYDDEVAQLNLQYETDIEYLDAVLQNAKDQLDIANGTYVEIKAVGEALKEFNAFGTAYINAQASKEAIWEQIGKATVVIGEVEIPSLKVKDEETGAQIALLSEQLAAQNRAIAENTQKTAKILSRWDGDGQPETRVV